LSVLGSYDQATRFLDHLNRLLLLLGLAAVLVGSGLVYVISHTFTRPLGSLVAGVRALERGDFYHPVDASGGDEVAELTRAFDRMRASLLKTQRDLLESEQLATIGRMASSISHDLRHSLAAIVANSEFLCDSHLSTAQREDLYQEVRTGVNQMTDLIDSLLEFARTRESLSPSYSDLCDTVQRSVQAVRLHPRHQGTSIEVRCNGPSSAWFDPRKLERALYNLLLNACEAAPSNGGKVEVVVDHTGDSVTITIADNGSGIPESIRDKLFHPFVSYGKENGTGLGLTVVQKIVEDHGGQVSVERTADGKTVFQIVLPGRVPQTSQNLHAAPVSASSLMPVKQSGSIDSIRHHDM
jgi:signal transduction histidine kinase